MAPERLNHLDASLWEIEQAQLARRLDDRFGAPQEAAYLFKHALVQDTAYASLLKHDRKKLHRLVAETLARVYASRGDELAAELAQHSAEAGDDTKSAEYALRAGELAKNMFAVPEAARFYTQTLASLARLPDTAENRQRRVDVILKSAPMLWLTQTPAQNLAQLNQAEELTQSMLDERGQGGGDPLLLARIHYLLGNAHMRHNQLGETVTYFEQVLSEAEGLGDEDLLANASAVLGGTKALQGHFDQAEPLLTRALKQVRPSTSFDRWEWTGAMSFACLTLTARGKVRSGLAVAEKGLPLLRASNNHVHLALLQFFVALSHLLIGDSQRALQVARASIASAQESRSQLYIYWGLALQAWAESRLGQHTAALQDFARAQALELELGPPLLLSDWFAAAEAELALNRGAFAEALVLAERAAALARSKERIFAEALAECLWGQALAALNPQTPDRAEMHLASALKLFEAGGAVLEAARTRVALGKLWRERGNGDGAREQFEKAAPQF